MIAFLPIILCVSIALNLLIDSSGWWLRTFSDGSNIGHFVARTNLYTYSGRLFSFFYMFLLSLFIEFGATSLEVCELIIISFVVGGIAHKILLNRSAASQYGLHKLANMMRLELNPVPVELVEVSYGHKLLLTTAAATTIFCLGMSAPYILASLFPTFRLTLASVGQILNAAGMMFILFFVDQLMYKSWDNRELGSAIEYYNNGRFIGTMCAAGFVSVLYLALKYKGY
jgi:hypothetical protein